MVAPDAPKRVAVIGASGIGRHHAKWWRLSGADVCAFAGTSDESVVRTRIALDEMFGFDGRGYTSVFRMLADEQPDIVDVCSPPPWHYDHVRFAIEAGCHVLCEKPFVYEPTAAHTVLVGQAQDLAGLALEKGLRLSVSTQYSVAARMFAHIWTETHPGELVTRYHGHLESPAKGRAPDPERIWADLSPHLISVLLRLVPDGRVNWSSLRTKFEGYEAIAEFEVHRAQGGPPIDVSLVTRNALEPPLNIRHFKYNGYPFSVEGENGPDGVYRARVETPDGNWVERDMMHALIQDFLAGSPTVDVKECIANLDLMLRISG